jgi:pyruvate dehydrogenase E2 component (dihydrolipoamide acetyltransferase)
MSEVTEVVVPDIGDFSDVPVIEVLVAPGDTVAPEDPLVTLESDKATMDVPAPAAGVVKELLVKVGDTVSEGTPILTLSAEGSEEPAAAVVAEASAEPQPPPQPAPPPVAAPSGNGKAASGPVYASPSVRRQARELGLDLSTVRGSGRKGRITKEDVQAAVRVPAPAPAGPLADGVVGIPGLNLAPWPKIDYAKHGPIERVPLPRIKRISGPNLARNWVMIPHVTHHDEADITELEAFRKQLNAEQSEVKVTMVALLLKACAAALDAFPRFASSLDGDELVVKPERHLGFAADTPGGLVVPVVHDVGAKGLLQLGAELTELSAKARAGKLGPKEMSGAVFTISSLGGIGGTGFTPIVNPPQVAILGVVRSATKPVWDGTAFVPRLVLPLSLSYDHRVIDGAAAARFTAHLAGLLSDLRRVLV